MAEQQIELDALVIAPFAKGMTKGVFDTPDENFKHLVNWYKTGALHAQRDKKSKTYVAIYEEKIVGYICLSMHHLKAIPGIIPFTTSFEFQVLQIGKLYVDPIVRGAGVGKRLMDFALDIAYNIDEMVGCVGLIVDANSDERTINFYTKYGFEPISNPEDEGTVQMFFKMSERAIIP